MALDIRISGTDISFPCEPGQTILDAAFKAGIEMPYSCRKGVCGNCAGAICAGEVQCPESQVASSGQFLYCRCVPQTDLEIAPESWQRVDPSARKILTARVFRNTLAAPDVNVLHLRLPAGQRIKFKAGQYLQIMLADGSRRSYSMANAPHESDSIQLHIRHVPGGQFTQTVPHLKSGDILKLELPFGDFRLRDESAAPMLCVVGGTGFAPVKSLMDDMAKRGIRRPVTLIWGGRDRSSIYLLDAVERWRKNLPEFVFLPALEDASDAAAMGAFHGRVDGALRAHAPASLSSHEVYCCGSPLMVGAVRKACVEERGLAPRSFFSDVFVPGPSAV